MRYRRALDTFNPRQLGKDAYDVMQIYTEITSGREVIVHKNINSAPPSRGKIKQRRQYMATAFFRQIKQVSLHEAELREGLYAETGSAQDDASKLWSDRVSDFDQLSPALQRTFGAELCDYLRDFYQAPTHCDYPFHRR